MAHSALVDRPCLKTDEALLSSQWSNQGKVNAAQLARISMRDLSELPNINGPRATYKATWYARKNSNGIMGRSTIAADLAGNASR